MYDAVHFEDNDAGAARFDRFPEAAGAVVIEVGDNVNLAAAAACGVFAETFGAGECKGLRHGADTREHQDEGEDTFDHSGIVANLSKISKVPE